MRLEPAEEHAEVRILVNPKLPLVDAALVLTGRDSTGP